MTCIPACVWRPTPAILAEETEARAPCPAEVYEAMIYDGEFRTSFNPNMALAALLIAGVVHIDRSSPTPLFFVACNDTWAWGWADAEPCTLADIEDLYRHHVRDPDTGHHVWACKRRGEEPQPPMVELVVENGWDMAEMRLRSNRYTGAMAKLAAARVAHLAAWEDDGGSPR